VKPEKPISRTAALIVDAVYLFMWCPVCDHSLTWRNGGLWCDTCHVKVEGCCEGAPQ